MLEAGQAVEIERKVQRDGHVTIAGVKCQIAFALARRTITIRLDGHLMHAIADGALAGTWPCPITAERAARLPGARTTATPLPPPPLPAGSIRAQRRVHANGRFSARPGAGAVWSPRSTGCGSSSPVPAAFARPNRKFFRSKRGMTWLNAIHDQGIGRGTKVVSGTVRDSLHMVDVIFGLDGGELPEIVVSDTGS